MEELGTITHSPEWAALTAHQDLMRQCSLAQLFQTDTQRPMRYALKAAGLFLDYSNNHCTQTTLSLLVDLAKRLQLSTHIARLFEGHVVNTTEGQPALHTALRGMPDSQHLFSSLSTEISAMLSKMEVWVDALRNGQYYGFSGEPIRHIVNIGIGGSYWGPKMVFEALTAREISNSYCNLDFYFVSSLDRREIKACLANCRPENTLFIVVSKSFLTRETLSNLAYAREWLKSAAGAECENKSITRHFIAVTAARERALEYGIDAKQILPFWDWLGGRYSVWSGVGLVLAIALGMPAFREFLAGAAAMDTHFKEAPLMQNMPVILALIGIWYTNFFNCHSHAIVPYCRTLQMLPHYLQQLHMESLGKSVQTNGQPVDYATGGVVWGGVATDSQHTFHQLLLQGTVIVPTDFIVPLYATHGQADHEEMIANFLAQSEVLRMGYQPVACSDFLKPHQTIVGNRPHTIITVECINPFTMGALLALYEHKVYTQSIIWRINAFDQWGVQRGKAVAHKILQERRAESHVV